MLIPHLHFKGNCEQAIALYEKAFHTKVKAKDIDTAPDGKIAHASMKIHGQALFLNDGKAHFEAIGVHFDTHLIVTFKTAKELLACYEILKADGDGPAPFSEAAYSELVGNFRDKFGVYWGFMVW